MDLNDLVQQIQRWLDYLVHQHYGLWLHHLF